MLSLVQVLYCLLLNRVLDLGQIIFLTRSLAMGFMEVLCKSKMAKEQSNDYLKVSLLELKHQTSSDLVPSKTNHGRRRVGVISMDGRVTTFTTL